MAVRGGSQGASQRLVTFVVFCLLVGTLTVLLPQAAVATTVSDSFDRANGGLGSQLDDGFGSGSTPDRE